MLEHPWRCHGCVATVRVTRLVSVACEYHLAATPPVRVHTACVVFVYGRGETLRGAAGVGQHIAKTVSCMGPNRQHGVASWRMNMRSDNHDRPPRNRDQELPRRRESQSNQLLDLRGRKSETGARHRLKRKPTNASLAIWVAPRAARDEAVTPGPQSPAEPEPPAPAPPAPAPQPSPVPGPTNPIPPPEPLADVGIWRSIANQALSSEAHKASHPNVHRAARHEAS